tara:strand:+ start:191 stop:418 length:228 start_codon:yes stop_codon:yes gene_type:complete
LRPVKSSTITTRLDLEALSKIVSNCFRLVFVGLNPCEQINEDMKKAIVVSLIGRFSCLFILNYSFQLKNKQEKNK